MQPDVGTSGTGLLPPRELLISRVLAGSALSRSPRLRELFRYVCDWSAANNGAPLTEEQIGVAVFGRLPGYDTSADTIVRVQISQLRRRLEQHFTGEGAAEPVVIEVPMRTYSAVFRPRDPAAAAVVDPEPLPDSPEPPSVPDVPVTVAPPGRRTPARLMAVALAASLCLVAWLLVDNYRLRRTVEGTNPASNQFLRQVFGDGRPALIVVSDGVALALNDYAPHLVTPQEYRGGFPGSLIGRLTLDAPSKQILQRIGGMNLTTLQDVQVTSDLVRRMTAVGIPTGVVYARDFRFQPQVPGNLIVIGHRKANPWTGVFEENLNFQYRWQNDQRAASMVNRSPKPGELSEYPVKFSIESYGLLALLPKPGGEGSVLLLEGGDMGSTLAAAALVGNDDQLGHLYQRLGIKSGGHVPPFEVLMRTRLTGNVVHQAEIVAIRIH